jgi:hypothetical protein
MPPSPWTAELVAALFTGIAGVIYALTKLFAQVKASRVEGRAAGQERDAKLATIATNVNGNLTKALEEIASLKQQNGLLIQMLAKMAAARTDGDGVAKVVETATNADAQPK